MKGTEMYVYLGIFGFKCSPERISQILGVKPTETFKRGDPIEGTRAKCKQNGWQYRIDAKEIVGLEPLVKKILKRFRDVRSLKKAVAMGRGTLTCVLYARDRSAEIWLSPPTLKGLAKIGCEFHLDYFILPENRKSTRR